MLKKLRQRFGLFAESVTRFPAVIACLAATAVLTAIAIEGEDGLTRYIWALAVGAFSSAAFQAAYERFFSGIIARICLTVCALAVMVLFYLSIRDGFAGETEFMVRSAVTAFALFIAFIWIGTVRGRYGFCDSFTAAFKALFESLFFSGILFLGCAAVIAAIDLLIINVDGDAYMHTANIVFVIIAPLIFLSLIPVYPGRGPGRAEPDSAQRALIARRIGCPRFLEVLLSYIAAPLVSVFTVILLAYIFINIGGEFWTDNLLEPLLVSYTITVIVVTVLTVKLENRFAGLFVKIFPKALIPVALFQVLASVVIMADTGVTFGRYYVILYGAFAVFSGAALSISPKKSSGIVALVLIVLSAISLIPPADAFSVSRNSQISALENTLAENGMLTGETVAANGTIPASEKDKIIAHLDYLESTQELDYIKWLPEGFSSYDDTAFIDIFGFSRYELPIDEYRYVSVYYDISETMPVGEYDVFVQVYIPDRSPYGQAPQTGYFETDAETYSVYTKEEEGHHVVVESAAGIEIIRFDARALRLRYGEYPGSRNMLTPEEATFEVENENAALRVIVLNAGFGTQTDSTDMNAQLLVFVNIK
ncbi:MAG: DUF4153 domain-containing protein [Clostridiales bacterium]|nr:DUF4153 domain-containing protein [Clostridiales bacterium]